MFGGLRQASRDQVATGPWPSAVFRSGILFANFFLIIMALYQLKPASRSLILAAHGTAILPYVWIGSAAVLLVAVSFYHRVLDRYSRLRVVLGTCLLFIVLLLGFRVWLAFPGKVASVAFYIFVDVLGVVLVEQFWSLTNSIYSTAEGKRWYGLVGTGGLVGGAVGSGAAALTIRYTPLHTPDLLLVAAAIIGVIFVLTWIMGRLDVYARAEAIAGSAPKGGNWRLLTHSRYLLLIAGALLLAQLVSPVVEYQFLRVIEHTYHDQETRTTVLSLFFSVLSAVSIAINVIITPLVLRYLGVLAGLLVQPLVLATTTYGFMSHPSLIPAATMKISDRGLSYSINRAAKELLYIPVDPVLIYQAKAWIDMFGYRIFKVAGSMLILVLTQWTTLASGRFDLSWVIIGGCLVWTGVLFALYREYRGLTSAPTAIVPPAT
ncbi:MAG: Npt1/Npt2 family nucleotide transporter [Gammaproteobacteria bacterium]